MGIEEGRAAGGEGIEVRGLGQRMAAEVADPVVLVVDRDEQHVGPLGGPAGSERPGHRRRLVKAAVVDQTRVGRPLQLRHQPAFERLPQRGLCGILSEVGHLLGIVLQVVELHLRPLAVDLVEVGPPTLGVSCADEPGLRGAGIFVGERGTGVVFQFISRWLRAVVQAVGITQRPAVGPEVVDQHVLMRADRPLWVGGEVGTGVFHMPLTAGEDMRASGIDLPAHLRGEHIPERAAGHRAWGFQPGRLQERGCEIDQADHVVHHAAACDTRARDRQADAGAEVVEVALAVREARSAMVAADHDQRVVGQALGFQFVDNHGHRGIPGGDLTEVVREVFPHLRHVGQEGGHLACQVVGVDVPEGLAAALDPCAVHVGRAKPVAKWRGFGP